MIFKKKVKGIIYIVERTTTDGKRHEKVIGKVDKDGNEMYYNNHHVQVNRASGEKGLEHEESTTKEESKPTSNIVPYRIKSNAEKNKPLIPCPDKLAVPTLPNYEHSISLHPAGNAYLEKLTISTNDLQFEDGKMFFKGAFEPISTVELKNIITKEGIEEIDIPLLTMYYSIILAALQEYMKQGLDFKYAADMVTRIYAPDLMRCLKTLENGSGTNENQISSIMRKTETFHNVIGILHITRNGRPDKSYFPVLAFAGYDAEDNTISFHSPYLMHVVRKIYSESIKHDKKGNPRLKRNGQPMLYPSHSYLIKPSIVVERNKAAVENVRIIVQVIEQAGDKGTPHIKASTIIERNEALKIRLSKDKNPDRLLKRVFKKTWELLRDKTTLLETYDGIKLPTPDNVKNIPTPGNLDEIVFSFPHNGKNKNAK